MSIGTATLGTREPAVLRRGRVLVSLAAAVGLFATWSSGQSVARDRHALDGIWNSATVTPLERPRELRDKAVFTPAEAVDWERQVAKNNEEPPDDAPRRGTGTYNTFYREFGTRTVKTLRTSIVTEPADGRIPILTPAAAEIKRQPVERQKQPEGPEDMGLQDRCLAFATAGPPMLPYSYNSNY